MKIKHLCILAGTLVLVLSACKSGNMNIDEAMEGTPDLSQYPSLTLRKGELEMKVFLPDPEKGLYRATRFDWSGVIGSVRYKDHEYFGYWKDSQDPLVHEDLTGPVEGWITSGPGWDEAEVGGKFMRIGVGILEKEADSIFQWRKTYKILDHGKWTVDHGSDWIRFTHELSGDFAYAYRYEKEIRLGESGFLIGHRLENLGEKSIETDQFNHNFFMIDGEPSGPAFEISFPWSIRTADDTKGLIEIRDSSLHFLEVMGERSVFLELEGFGSSPADHQITVRNKKSGAGVTFSVDRPLYRMAFWSCGTTLSPENFIWLSVEPGETEEWNSEYRLFVE